MSSIPLKNSPVLFKKRSDVVALAPRQNSLVKVQQANRSEGVVVSVKNSTLIPFNSLYGVDIDLANNGDVLTYDANTDTWVSTSPTLLQLEYVAIDGGHY